MEHFGADSALLCAMESRDDWMIDRIGGMSMFNPKVPFDVTDRITNPFLLVR